MDVERQRFQKMKLSVLCKETYEKFPNDVKAGVKHLWGVLVENENLREQVLEEAIRVACAYNLHLAVSKDRSKRWEPVPDATAEPPITMNPPGQPSDWEKARRSADEQEGRVSTQVSKGETEPSGPLKHALLSGKGTWMSYPLANGKPLKDYIRTDLEDYVVLLEKQRVALGRGVRFLQGVIERLPKWNSKVGDCLTEEMLDRIANGRQKKKIG